MSKLVRAETVCEIMPDMPEGFVARRVSGLKPGQGGFVVPWAVYHSGGVWWVRGDYDVDSEQGGTSALYIERDINGGVVVDLRTMQDYPFTWDKGRDGMVRREDLPVVVFLR